MTNKRAAELSRKTKETQITIKIKLDGTGNSKINTSFKFMDHMLTLFSKHSLIDLEIESSGDLTHHVVEDIGIVLGSCLNEALGDKKGINRYGMAFIPMDDALARCVIDFSGRKALVLELDLNECNIEDVAVEDVYHFLNSFCENAKMNLHLHVLYGQDQHHKVEAAFKALARAVKDAIKVVSEEIPSSKGMLM